MRVVLHTLQVSSRDTGLTKRLLQENICLITLSLGVTFTALGDTKLFKNTYVCEAQLLTTIIKCVLI